MNDKNLATLYRQLATMLDAGLPVVRALTVLVEQQSGAAAALSQRLQGRVQTGSTLADAMALEPRQIPPPHIGLIRVGEKTGRVDQILVQLAEGLESGVKLRNQLLAKLLYPLIVVHVALLAKAVIAYFLVSPAAGVLSLAFGFGILYGLLLGGAAVFRLLRSVPSTRYLIDLLAWNLPLIRGIVRSIGTARFARTCEAMYRSGHHIAETVAAAAGATGNSVMISRLQVSVATVREGGELSRALAEAKVFSPMVRGMLQTGAESGKLEQMLHKVAENAEYDAQVAIERMGTVLPLILYMMVVVWVGYTIISLFITHIIGPYLNEMNQ